MQIFRHLRSPLPLAATFAAANLLCCHGSGDSVGTGQTGPTPLGGGTGGGDGGVGAAGSSQAGSAGSAAVCPGPSQPVSGGMVCYDPTGATTPMGEGNGVPCPAMVRDPSSLCPSASAICSRDECGIVATIATSGPTAVGTSCCYEFTLCMMGPACG